jgi:GNAT superfamily N-acetyltransferase
MITARATTGLEVLPLRMAVLRPDQPVVEPDWHLFDDVHHFGAYDGDQLVGCATVFPSAYETTLDEPVPDAWQLRGMAVMADRQGQGIGAIVLAEAIEVVRASGAPLLWANARVTALNFYERLGFDVVGEVFDYGPASLPHKKIEMWFGGRS